MVFFRVEPGSFVMGKTANDKMEDTDTVSYDEQPAHKVTLTRPFYILRNAVSHAQFEMSGSGLSGWARDASFNWYQAAAFCAWLSESEGRIYRLPTEAEWEKAGLPATQPPLREWVQDWHGLYPVNPVVDPVGPATGVTRVIREGARRASLPPDASSRPWRLPAIGFRVVLEIEPPTALSVSPQIFVQSAIKQGNAQAKLGPDPKIPYFTVRFALPIPPEDDNEHNGALAGLDQSAMAHNHSPGFEILPNGDALAIYFSSRDTHGGSESAPETRFVAARLRFGAEEWDPPELFCDFKPLNDQSGLLWTEGDTVRFFGGGRCTNSEWMPFQMAVSTNNGATWAMTLPFLDELAPDCTPQPIVNAFRGPDKSMFFAMDGKGDKSFLWRSMDNGVHWHDMGGRTGGRHSTIVPLDEKGALLSIGGKGSTINGWSPQSTSQDWGASWTAPTASPFPSLASNQRPCLIRLANGHLCFVSDSYRRKEDKSPEGWTYGEGCFVAISSDNGEKWRIKRLPVELPHYGEGKYGTLGYSTVRQAPNGVIHLLTTMTHPSLHYEFNEAWVLSDAGVTAPEPTTGSVRTYAEKYPNHVTRAAWGARQTANGRYLLFGTETTYYESGNKEHEVTYKDGCKIGEETFWAPDGTKLWSWTHDPTHHTSTWVHYWDNGEKRIESRWNTEPQARGMDRRLHGLVANGPAYHWSRDGSATQSYNFTNGILAGTLPLTVAGRAQAERN